MAIFKRVQPSRMDPRQPDVILSETVHHYSNRREETKQKLQSSENRGVTEHIFHHYFSIIHIFRLVYSYGQVFRVF